MWKLYHKISHKTSAVLCLPERPWSVQGHSFCKQRLHGLYKTLVELSCKSHAACSPTNKHVKHSNGLLTRHNLFPPGHNLEATLSTAFKMNTAVQQEPIFSKKKFTSLEKNCVQ